VKTDRIIPATLMSRFGIRGSVSAVVKNDPKDRSIEHAASAFAHLGMKRAPII
jgi:hypothetical protein